MIYCFDFEKVHGIVEKPNSDRYRCSLQSVGVLDECLSCIINSECETKPVCVMKHYGMRESWNLFDLVYRNILY